ncbi:hypothetical protein [Aeromonas hydrophila]|uniref:hypothetical protein n=1 Tax=Aeromonas hydrophila TaxID=644 RepID=UPI001F0D3678|nr:hypothetical protein [Aeromonas hydrophila]
MTLTPGKTHLTALDILLELRCWLANNVEMQTDPAIVPHLPNGYLLTQADCSTPLMRCSITCAISRARRGQAPCDYPIPIP